MTSSSGKDMAMEYNQLLELIKTVSESNITGFHYENGDTKVIISTVESGLAGIGTVSGTPVTGVQATCNTADTVKESDSGAPAVQTNSGETSAIDVQETTGNIIKSPLVGTFYAAPSEDAAPFVNVGDYVKAGQTLAIVEAMKLMNDIESEFDGKVTQIFVKNGDCVEYGQPLFAIR